MYTLRLFENHEWENLKTIRLEGLQTYPDMLGQPYAKASEFTKEDWQEWTDDPLRGYFGIYDQDILIGFYFIRIFSDDLTQARMNVLYIKREYQRKNIDILLFETGLNWARQMGCTTIKAGCKETNYASKRLIEKYGGVFIGKSDEVSDYPDGSSGYTLWFLLEVKDTAFNSIK